MRSFVFAWLTSLLFFSCNVEPQPINYGTDACHYCQMTIVDKQHASQLVTSKGKAYKYDAIECMVHSLQDEFQDIKMTHYLVADFENPGKLVDAKDAHYLVSPHLQSPMGANLTAFDNKEASEKALTKYEGKLYDWQAIKEHLKL